VDRAQSSLFELTRLQIGMVAPDIEGADLNGVAFKLSDYRGKVVVIDFWGNW
jgi:peroxiredoxin